ncbi:globin [Phenylobacterium sp. LH3H17]|uniref:globin n=1 Tax=Phenylobacterium sp. LH3H17 TaxID=2903901 RepID=UPI0020CA20DB|nr:globin [Phenylobacterium sp. LH3H17]UTP37895.1 globin [Phenylobacterium sp. LH3H17]
MTDETNLIAWSLEEVAERHGDPTQAVYDRLFAKSPEMAELFIGDKTGAARGEMLAVVFRTLLDFSSEGAFGANMVRAEIINHEGIGVPPKVFTTFFATVMETMRDLLGEDWTPPVAAAWDELLVGLDAAIHRETAA